MDEQILINELIKRNKTVFETIFISYYSSLCAFAYKFLGSRELAEDVVQDFFVYFWIESPRLEIKNSLRAYLFASVRNRCLDWFKLRNSSEKYKRSILSNYRETDLEEDEMISETELRMAVYKALQKCSPRSREIFTMSRIDGLSNTH